MKPAGNPQLVKLISDFTVASFLVSAVVFELLERLLPWLLLGTCKNKKRVGHLSFTHGSKTGYIFNPYIQMACHVVNPCLFLEPGLAIELGFQVFVVIVRLLKQVPECCRPVIFGHIQVIHDTAQHDILLYAT
jgi:hypothetical protein